MIKTYEIDTDPEYFNESEDYLKYLLCEDMIVVNNGWWKKDWPKDKITISVICSDIFAWGCADAEDIDHCDLKEVAEAHAKDPMWGVAAWCIKKRKQMPQKPVAERMKAAGYDLEALVAGDNSQLNDTKQPVCIK